MSDPLLECVLLDELLQLYGQNVRRTWSSRTVVQFGSRQLIVHRPIGLIAVIERRLGNGEKRGRHDAAIDNRFENARKWQEGEHAWRFFAMIRTQDE